MSVLSRALSRVIGEQAKCRGGYFFGSNFE
jgi:hypothetical protein